MVQTTLGRGRSIKHESVDSCKKEAIFFVGFRQKKCVSWWKTEAKEQALILTYVSFNRGKKSKYQEGSDSGTGRICKGHTERLESELDPGPSCCEATALTSAPPCPPAFCILYLCFVQSQMRLNCWNELFIFIFWFWLLYIYWTSSKVSATSKNQVTAATIVGAL